MFVARKILLCFVIAALPLALTGYAYAQENNSERTPLAPPHRQLNDNSTNSIPPQQAFSPTNTNPEWQSKLEERTERREFREEAQAIRTEHEDLELERDRLKSQCMDAKGQERTSCHDQWQILKSKQEVLHQRIMSLHERMQAERNRDVPSSPNEPGQWRTQHTLGQQQDPGLGGGGGEPPNGRPVIQNQPQTPATHETRPGP